jgi:hypothetical protein
MTSRCEDVVFFEISPEKKPPRQKKMIVRV